MTEQIKRRISFEDAQKKLGLAETATQQYTLPGALLKILGSNLEVTLFDVTDSGVPDVTFVTSSPFIHQAQGKQYFIQAEGTGIRVEEEIKPINARLQTLSGR